MSIFSGLGLYSSPYMDDYNRTVRKLCRPGKPVRHQQTCPDCGRKLVNTYLKNSMWKCKKCWDEMNEKEKTK